MNAEVLELTPEEQELQDLQAFVDGLEFLLQEGRLPWYAYGMLTQGRLLLDAGLSRLPEPVPVVTDLWDENGFSAEMDEHGCVQYYPLYDLAEDWAKSDNRFERYGATFVNQNFYLIALPNRPDQDEAWREGYEVAYQASSTNRLGPYGFNNGKVWTDYTKPPFRMWKGVAPAIPDHYVPWVPRTISADHEATLLETFTGHYDSDVARAKFYAVAQYAVIEMDVGRKVKWSGYTGPEPGEDYSVRGNPYKRFSS